MTLVHYKLATALKNTIHTLYSVYIQCIKKTFLQSLFYFFDAIIFIATQWSPQAGIIDIGA